MVDSSFDHLFFSFLDSSLLSDDPCCPMFSPLVWPARSGGFSNRVLATPLHWYNYDCAQVKAITLHASHFLQVSIPLCNLTALFSFQSPRIFLFVCFSLLCLFPPWIYSYYLQECGKLDFTSLFLYKSNRILDHLILDGIHVSYSKK